MKVEDKIFHSLEDLLFQTKIWKNDFKKIVFTNGCFDLIHRGHADYLNKAKLLGDKLVVGLNSDKSVSELKGVNRPLQNEADRMYILASFECIDAVIIFSEETPIKLIQTILPDVLTKGGDYDALKIVGANEVIENGGSVCVLPFIKGRSTSLIEEKIRNQKTQ